MEPSKAVKEYKEELAQVHEENEALTKIVGKMTVEKKWLEKKLVSLDLSEGKPTLQLNPRVSNLAGEVSSSFELVKSSK